MLDLWDRAFGTDFFSYRAQLQDLAYGTFAAAGADAISRGFGDFDAWWDDPDEQIVVPMDDDDFLMGPLRDLVPAFTQEVDVALWPRAALALQDDGTMGWQSPILYCIFATNSALRLSFLRRHFTRDEAVEILADHSLANERIADVLGVHHDDIAMPGFRRLKHPRVSLLPKWYSLKNGHVGSIQLLKQTLQRPDPVGYLKSRTLDVQHPRPVQVASLAPQIGALAEIWASMRRTGPLPAP